jgi:hypothetical protein
MAYIDTLTMFNELVAAGCTEKVARSIVILTNEMRKELESKIDILNNRLSNYNK